MFRTILLLVTAAILITGCGGSSGSSSQDVNLSITNIGEPANSANAGHAIDITYTLRSTAVADNVVVSFYLINNDQFAAQNDDESTPQSEQYYLGADDIDTVLDGDNHRSAEFLIPDNISTEGNYFIIAHVDPDDLIYETDETDNTFTTTSSTSSGRASQILLNVSTDYVDTTNLVVKELVLEDAVIILDSSDLTAAIPALVDLTQEYPAHGNMHLHGHAVLQIEGRVPTVTELQQIKAKAQVKVGGVWTDLYYWNNDLGTYADYVTLQAVEADADTLEDDEEAHRTAEEHILAFDVNIPAATAIAMLNEIVADAAALLSSYNKFDIRLLVDSDNVIAELDETDNSYELTVNVYSFPNAARSGSDYLMEKSYDKGVGSKKKVKIALDMYAKNGLETGTKKGAILKNEISLPAWAFKKSRNIFAIRDQHSAYVNSLGDTGYSQEIELLGVTVYGEEQWADQITISYLKEWRREKPIAFVDFFIGPVPLTMETGVDGAFGINLSATLSAIDNTPILSTDNNLPQIDFDLYASAGVGSSQFSAGPIAALVLIQEILNFYNFATMDYDEGLDHINSASIGMTISNTLKSIQGKFGVYVKYPTIKWCKKWGIPYPCGTKRAKKTKYYYKTKALVDKKQKLYEASKTWNF